MSLLKIWNKNLIPSISNLNSFFDESLFDSSNEEYLPAVNVKDMDNTFELEIAAPGYSKGDLEIQIQDNYLKVIAKTENEEVENNENYTRKEFSQSAFKRSFYLPENIDQEHIEAEFKNGLLKLSLPKHTSSIKKSSKVVEIN